MKTNLVILAVTLAGLAWCVVHVWGQPWTPMRIAGAVIGLPSVALLILARIQLGGSFSVGAKTQALITHGLYSRIRKPIYVFGGLTVAGVFFVLPSAEISVAASGAHSLADLPCEEGRAGACRQVRGRIPGVQGEDVVLSSFPGMEQRKSSLRSLYTSVRCLWPMHVQYIDLLRILRVWHCIPCLASNGRPEAKVN